MGVKKLSRGRLFNAEKLGKLVDVSPSVGMKEAVVSSTQHREGYKVITDVVVDVGTSKAVIESGGITPDDPCGVSGSVAYICQVTDAVFGIVTQLDIICIEGLTDGTLTDYDIMSSSAGTAKMGDTSTANQNITGSDGTTHAKNVLATPGQHTTLTFDAEGLKNQYIYLGAGQTAASAGHKGSCTITVSTADTGSIVNLNTNISLRANDLHVGTIHHFSASTGTAFGGSAVHERFNVKNADAAVEIAQGISLGIHNHAEFTTDASSRGGSSATITVTHNNLSLFGDQTNPGWIDAPSQTTDITVGDFVSASPKQFTAGKFLLRFTGFMVPDDL